MGCRQRQEALLHEPARAEGVEAWRLAIPRTAGWRSASNFKEREVSFRMLQNVGFKMGSAADY